MGTKQTVTIIGEGAYGSALGRVITSNGHTVRFFDQDPAKQAISKYPPLGELLSGTTIVILAIPSQFAPKFLQFFPPEYKNLPFISVIKGILDPEVFADFPNFSVLSGPAFAEDLDHKKPVTLTATSQIISGLLTTDWLKIELTSDIVGIMACGTLKNCYAIGSGFLSLQPDTPQFDDYISKSLNEMKQAIQILGGDPNTANLACGISDLQLTCGSNISRNYQFGKALANNVSANPRATTEGLTALLSLPNNLAELPILHELISLTRKNVNDLSVGDVEHIQ